MSTVTTSLPLGTSRLRWETWTSTGHGDLRRQSRALDELRQGDYSSVIDEITRILPHSSVEPRFLPLVERMVAERATSYMLRPRRHFANTTPSATDKFRAIYSASGIDAALKLAEEKLVPQDTVVVGVLPDRLRKVRLESWCPFEVEITPGNPLAADDIQQASEVRLRIPVGASDDQVVYGFVVMTPNEIYVEAGGRKTPLYGNSTRNPFPAYQPYPLVVLRSCDAPKGQFFAPVDQGLLAEAIGLSLAMTDLEHVVRHTQPQRVVTFDAESPASADDQQNLPTGVDNWVSLPPGASLATVHSQAQVAEGLSHIEQRLKQFAALRGLPSDTFTRTYQSITAIGLADHDRKVGRIRYQNVMREAETEVAQTIARVCNLTDVQPLPETVSVVVAYGELVAEGGQDAAQARMTSYQTGESSPAEFVSRRDHITLDAAKQRVADNLDSQAKAQPAPVTP
ncbi:MAG: hypothetical protein H6747_09635 [Deltaproteobacteria bacterium]|nr:hypothetical protein [Deltaproteobacteria bacterium]